MTRVPVRKTYKLYVGGAFPRSESGRTYEAEGHNIARGSRKDLRNAVRAARGAASKWAGMTAYNRGQVLYRVAEMMEARSAELAELCAGVVNILTGLRDELSPHLAAHLDVDALDLDRSDAELERAAADNVKRVVFGRPDAQSPYDISKFLELKTVWHPMGR